MRQIPGNKLLLAYLTRNNLTREAFAAKFAQTFGAQHAVSKTSVVWWINGKQRPESLRREQIAIVTGGDVPATAWVTAQENASLKRGRDRLKGDAA